MRSVPEICFKLVKLNIMVLPIRVAVEIFKVGSSCSSEHDIFCNRVGTGGVMQLSPLHLFVTPKDFYLFFHTLHLR